MFDVDEFLAECSEAVVATEPRSAVREVLERAVRRPEQVARALPATRGELVPLHASERLTVMKGVWGPGMRFRPHNHLMWAAIGLYGGQEDNTFYRRSGDGIVVSGGRELRSGDVALLGDDTIHAVENPRRTFTGAIHVYGGGNPAPPRRRGWGDDTGREVGQPFRRTPRHFQSVSGAAAAGEEPPPPPP